LFLVAGVRPCCPVFPVASSLPVLRISSPPHRRLLAPASFPPPCVCLGSFLFAIASPCCRCVCRPCFRLPLFRSAVPFPALVFRPRPPVAAARCPGRFLWPLPLPPPAPHPGSRSPCFPSCFSLFLSFLLFPFLFALFPFAFILFSFPSLSPPPPAAAGHARACRPVFPPFSPSPSLFLVPAFPPLPLRLPPFSRLALVLGLRASWPLPRPLPCPCLRSVLAAFPSPCPGPPPALCTSAPFCPLPAAVVLACSRPRPCPPPVLSARGPLRLGWCSSCRARPLAAPVPTFSPALPAYRCPCLPPLWALAFRCSSRFLLLLSPRRFPVTLASGLSFLLGRWFAFLAPPPTPHHPPPTPPPPPPTPPHSAPGLSSGPSPLVWRPLPSLPAGPAFLSAFFPLSLPTPLLLFCPFLLLPPCLVFWPRFRWLPPLFICSAGLGSVPLSPSGPSRSAPLCVFSLGLLALLPLAPPFWCLRLVLRAHRFGLGCSVRAFPRPFLSPPPPPPVRLPVRPARSLAAEPLSPGPPSASPAPPPGCGCVSSAAVAPRVSLSLCPRPRGPVPTSVPVSPGLAFGESFGGPLCPVPLRVLPTFPPLRPLPLYRRVLAPPPVPPSPLPRSGPPSRFLLRPPPCLALPLPLLLPALPPFPWFLPPRRPPSSDLVPPPPLPTSRLSLPVSPPPSSPAIRFPPPLLGPPPCQSSRSSPWFFGSSFLILLPSSPRLFAPPPARVSFLPFPPAVGPCPLSLGCFLAAVAYLPLARSCVFSLFRRPPRFGPGLPGALSLAVMPVGAACSRSPLASCPRSVPAPSLPPPPSLGAFRLFSSLRPSFPALLWAPLPRPPSALRVVCPPQLPFPLAARPAARAYSVPPPLACPRRRLSLPSSSSTPPSGVRSGCLCFIPSLPPPSLWPLSLRAILPCGVPGAPGRCFSRPFPRPSPPPPSLRPFVGLRWRVCPSRRPCPLAACGCIAVFFTRSPPSSPFFLPGAPSWGFLPPPVLPGFAAGLLSCSLVRPAPLLAVAFLPRLGPLVAFPPRPPAVGSFSLPCSGPFLARPAYVPRVSPLLGRRSHPPRSPRFPFPFRFLPLVLSALPVPAGLPPSSARFGPGFRSPWLLWRLLAAVRCPSALASIHPGPIFGAPAFFSCFWPFTARAFPARPCCPIGCFGPPRSSRASGLCLLCSPPPRSPCSLPCVPSSFALTLSRPACALTLLPSVFLPAPVPLGPVLPGARPFGFAPGRGGPPSPLDFPSPLPRVVLPRPLPWPVAAGLLLSAPPSPPPLWLLFPPSLPSPPPSPSGPPLSLVAGPCFAQAPPVPSRAFLPVCLLRLLLSPPLPPRRFPLGSAGDP